MLWTAQDERSALTVAYTRVSCIVMGVLLLALLAILINPAIASEQAGACHPADSKLYLQPAISGEQLHSSCVTGCPAGSPQGRKLAWACRVHSRHAGMRLPNGYNACFSAARVACMLQVVGSLRSALVDLDKLNRLVWEEVMHTCNQEALRATVSQRSLNRTAMREASARSLMAGGGALPGEPSRAAAAGHGNAQNGLSHAVGDGSSSGGDAASKCMQNGGAGEGQARLLRQQVAEEEARTAADAEQAEQDEARLASQGEAGESGRGGAGGRGEWRLELGALCGYKGSATVEAAEAHADSAEEQVQNSFTSP